LEKTNLRIKIGPITLALGLIALGTGALAGNFGLSEAGSLLKLWPLLLIGLGLEYFIRKLTSGEKDVQFSIPVAFLIGIIALAMWSVNTLYKIAPVDFIEQLFINQGIEHTRNWQGDPLVLAGSNLEIENKIGNIEITPAPTTGCTCRQESPAAESPGTKPGPRPNRQKYMWSLALSPGYIPVPRTGTAA